MHYLLAAPAHALGPLYQLGERCRYPPGERHQDDFFTGQRETVTKIKEGPIAFICTTVHSSVDAEMDTRLTTLKTTETPEQTRAVFKATAEAR